MVMASKTFHLKTSINSLLLSQRKMFVQCYTYMLTYVKDQLCSSCEMSKKRSSFHDKAVLVKLQRKAKFASHGEFVSWSMALVAKHKWEERWGKIWIKMKEKGDPCVIGGDISTQSKGYRVYNKRTRLIVESIHIKFDEIKEMMSDHNSSGTSTQRQEMSVENVYSGLDEHHQFDRLKVWELVRHKPDLAQIDYKLKEVYGRNKKDEEIRLQNGFVDPDHPEKSNLLRGKLCRPELVQGIIAIVHVISDDTQSSSRRLEEKNLYYPKGTINHGPLVSKGFLALKLTPFSDADSCRMP
ncbi:hypothetical protein Tco_0964473 [Tanacetum coccineum]